MHDGYEAVIGLEVHAELATRSKIFCSCPSAFGAPPNTLCCPVCMGFPGTLPVLNRNALALGIKAGLATHCTISSEVRFHRKHYSYPDLPKAYQITQYDLPLCSDGNITFPYLSEHHTVSITRIHLEEDAGKLFHTKDAGTLVDHNRCGVPLIEIVTEPQIHSADEAVAFLKALRMRLLYAGISDCKMQEGSLRCDVNLSVRKKGETTLGVRTEMKNLNSFTAVRKAIDSEFRRQISVLELGGEIFRETRRFDEETGGTILLRRKETEADYGFFPEPDLPPFRLEQGWVDSLKMDLPKMPEEQKAFFKEECGIGEEESELLVSSPALAEYFTNCSALTSYKKQAATLLLGELLGKLPADPSIEDFSADPSALARVATLWGEGKLNSTAAKTLALLVWEGERDPDDAVRRLDLAQISDPDILSRWIRTAFEKNPDMVESYRKGKTKAAKALAGAVMAESKGKAEPVLMKRLLERQLALL